jgi:hypothetical protein
MLPGRRQGIEDRTSPGGGAGAFAITPVLNSLLPSRGFFLLLSWAAANGMFHDIERPKPALLEREAELDAEQAKNANARELSDE